MKITDEQLSAFLDGELAEADRRDMSEKIAADETLQARLDGLTRADDAFRDAMLALDEEPMPGSVITMLTPDEDTPRPQRKPVQPAARLKFWQRPTFALAASTFTFILGVMMTQTPIDPGNAPVIGPLEPASALADALEASPSGATSGAEPMAIAITLTFQSLDGRWCREFRYETELAGRGIACRSGDQWQVALLSRAGGPSAPGGSYAPASSASAPAFDAAVDAMISSDPLSREAEIQLLEEGWPAPEDG